MPKMTRSHYHRVSAGLAAFSERHDLPPTLAVDLFRTMADALEGTSETFKRDRFLACCQREAPLYGLDGGSRAAQSAADDNANVAPIPAWEPRFLGRFTEPRRAA